jgi:hypothetical protein
MFFIFTFSLVVLVLAVELDRLYKSISNILYTKDTSKLGYVKNTSKGIYMEGTYNKIYTRNRNKIVYIEFAGC